MRRLSTRVGTCETFASILFEKRKSVKQKKLNEMRLTLTRRYERDLKRLLDRLVFECDNRIRRASERVGDDNARSRRDFTPEEQAVLDKYTQQIVEQSKRAEELGEAGDVDGGG